jgi:hypothetical protein
MRTRLRGSMADMNRVAAPADEIDRRAASPR